MAIDRAPWNALVDDDGSNLIGSVWNKAAIKTVLLDPIDAMGTPYQVITNAETGPIANWTPAGFGTRNTLIYWTGSANATIGALKAGVEGQIVLIKNRGTGILRCSHFATASAGYTAFFNVATSAPTPIAPEGWIQFIATQGVWVACGHEQGQWIPEPYNAAHFGGFTVTAGQLATSRYRLAGRALTWSLEINGANVPSSITQLTVRLPGGFTAACVARVVAHMLAGGVWGVGFASPSTAGQIDLVMNRIDFSAFAAGAVYAIFVWTGEVT
jgi:hypothetical protein